MREKLTIEQFREKRKVIQELLDTAEEYYETHSGEPGIDDYEQSIVNQYMDLQDDLLSYDLGDIPFEEWDGFDIATNETRKPDFTGTNANLDFDKILYDLSVNYKTCNVTNIQNVISPLDPDKFDDKVIEENPTKFLPKSLSPETRTRIMRDGLEISELASFPEELINELKQLDVYIYSNKANVLRELITIDKAIDLYRYDAETFETVQSLAYLMNSDYYYRLGKPFEEADFIEAVAYADVSNIKQVFYNYIRKCMAEDRNLDSTIKKFPEAFIKDNQDILLLGDNIPEELRKKYLDRKLSVDDVLNNYEIFKDIPVTKFIDMQDKLSYSFENMSEWVGDKEIQLFFKEYPEAFNYILRCDLASRFKDFYNSERLELDPEKGIKEQLKEYLEPFFRMHNQIDSVSKLNNYDPSLFELDSNYKQLFEIMGLENIRKLEDELSILSHKSKEGYYLNLEFLRALAYYLPKSYERLNKGHVLDFKNGTLPYEEFKDEFAKLLNSMRKSNIFTDYPDYGWLQGEFREKHPEIFFDSNDEKMNEAYYKNRIGIRYIYENPECIPFLLNRDLANEFTFGLKLDFVSMVDKETGSGLVNSCDFAPEYIQRYGNEKFLNLITKYGLALENLNVGCFHNEIEDEVEVEKAIRKSIIKKIRNSPQKPNYKRLETIEEFIQEYPELFLTINELSFLSDEDKTSVRNLFYNHDVNPDLLRNHPELIDLLSTKDFDVCAYNNLRIGINSQDGEFINNVGLKEYLRLCSIYGRFINGIGYYHKAVLHEDSKVEEIEKFVQEFIVYKIFDQKSFYTPDNAPDFLVENYPQLFLSEDAPEDLKNHFYGPDQYITFKTLKEHKDWLPYLKGKSLYLSMIRCNEDYENYFRFFGEEQDNIKGVIYDDQKEVKLAITRAEVVDHMMNTGKLMLMRSWYDKTGGKFIPDYVVMENFPLEEADKFLTAGSSWSRLMRLGEYSKSAESRDAVLKLAYSFGVFDQDQRGFKKLQDLLTDLPRKLNEDQSYVLENINSLINQYSQSGKFHHVIARTIIKENGETITSKTTPSDIDREQAYNQMIEYVKENDFLDTIDNNMLLNLLQSLKEENVDIDFSHDLFTQIYRKNEDGTSTLTLNSQNYPKSTQAIREILEQYRSIPIINPDRAHQLFGGFGLIYDEEFREFLLNNMDEILNTPEYATLLSSIQRQFKEIKAINSNRQLTLPLAVSFVKTNKYSNINVGNDRVAEISSIAGYSQADFNKLQEIYNYGKQRTYSSIPRIENTKDNYHYEMLRLDDPLAMAIGTLTDCCQELGNCAEVCMEHSMVDKNGRVFVIKDSEGNIVAQSWVWRNKDVLCFDNIEIPDKAFARARKDNPEGGNQALADEVYEIYKQAANDLIEEDKKIYDKLLEEGKITQEQYDGLRLGKITVGLGYNDIADSLKAKAPVDKGRVSRPLQFKEPVKLERGLYTNDSNTQYILEERPDRVQYDGETLPVHSDLFIEYDDSNFKEKSLLTLEKLELITKENPNYLDTSLSEYDDPEHLVTALARNYGLNTLTTRIVMNSNLAIIYDDNNGKIKIGDLLFNTKVDNNIQQMDMEDKVVIQIRLALEQIVGDKEVDVSELNEKQLAMYNKAIGLTEELDNERGVGHAR